MARVGTPLLCHRYANIAKENRNSSLSALVLATDVSISITNESGDAVLNLAAKHRQYCNVNTICITDEPSDCQRSTIM